MLIWESEPMTRSNAVEHLEMLGGVVVIQGRVLQLSLLEHHFAFRWTDEPDVWVLQKLEEAPELANLYIDASASNVQQAYWLEQSRTLPFEYAAMGNADAAFQYHRQRVEPPVGQAQVERILISLRASDSLGALVCEYIP
ncbi:hypothetical protein [Marinobacterium sediminicola]|uniref:Uncharacterized protein n=1 Tax=Marinobacterium sediminicola TaxID=518898 RepID=A0ABY1S296_9GAMM|nr:hypothetical protein [Marinobacterium sediminicola]ULG69415.1 hypothetical protein LN244_00980 [Marinobacterium sediminicola]SMR75565.1 hypothetical protein SAMN04487964_110102 [Marinobacterium sediminicola]